MDALVLYKGVRCYSSFSTARTMKNVEDCKGCKGSKGTFSNIYIRVFLHTYIKLAKVIETTFATFAGCRLQVVACNFYNIYIYVYFYTHIKLAKVIGVTCNYLQPPATIPFTATSDGGEKKVEKKLPKNLEGVGSELYICSAVSEKKVAPVNPRACEVSTFPG